LALLKIAFSDVSGDASILILLVVIALVIANLGRARSPVNGRSIVRATSLVGKAVEQPKGYNQCFHSLAASLLGPPMSLGIKPTVDFVFKKIFGSPENAAALIGLLNAILNFRRPIVAVEILNPFSYQEFAESKLIVLDVRCRDSESRWLNVEMQVSVYAGLLERLVF